MVQADNVRLVTYAALPELVQDLVAGMFDSTQGTGVAFSYNDTTGKLTVTVAGGTGGGVDTEAAQDIFGAMVAQAGGTYNDNLGTVTFPASGGGTATFDAEQTRDAIAQALGGSGYVTVTANDGADTITVGSASSLDTALANRLRFDAGQTLTDPQKAQLKTNAGIVDGTTGYQPANSSSTTRPVSTGTPCIITDDRLNGIPPTWYQPGPPFADIFLSAL